MTTGGGAGGNQLNQIAVTDPADAWEAAGFAVADGRLTIGSTSVVCGQKMGDGSGITGLGIAGIGANTLGLFDGAALPHGDGSENDVAHPNGVGSIDHVVMMTKDCDATTGELERLGLEARRVRRFEARGAQQRQTFFWMGDVILELVGPDTAETSDAADGSTVDLWGLALTCPDLVATTTWLGERSSEPRTAVQPGREIATLRTRELGISVAIALMSPHPKSAD